MEAWSPTLLTARDSPQNADLTLEYVMLPIVDSEPPSGLLYYSILRGAFNSTINIQNIL